MSEEAWNAYFWPGTEVLRNLLGVRDQEKLTALENQLSADRQREIASGEVVIPRTYDDRHLRAIHQQLFRDVYAWAGGYRTVGLVKGADRFFAPPSGIDRCLETASGLIAHTDWAALDQEQFVQSSALVYACANYGHPFREGNGRALFVYLEHVAELSPFELDFAGLSDEGLRQEWNRAREESRPTSTMRMFDPAPLEVTFRRLVRRRSQPSEPALSAEHYKAQQLLDSSHGRPASEASRQPVSEGSTSAPSVMSRARPPYRRERGGRES